MTKIRVFELRTGLEDFYSDFWQKIFLMIFKFPYSQIHNLHNNPELSNDRVKIPNWHVALLPLKVPIFTSIFCLFCDIFFL